MTPPAPRPPSGTGPASCTPRDSSTRGGPASGLCLQLVDEPGEELPVPETDYDFRALIRAQALGDYQALRQRGRRVLRLNLGADPAAGLDDLEQLLEDVL